MLFKGIIKLKIGGVERGFKFGMLASGYFCEEEKITLKEMTDRLSNPTPITAINCLFSAAKSYAVAHKLPVDFEVSDVADWIDEIGIDKTFEMIFESMETYQKKGEKEEGEKKELPPPSPGGIGQ